MLKALKKILPEWFLFRRTIMVRDFSMFPPVIVFQMGNVGSSTIYETLLYSSLPNPVFHVHYLFKDGIRAAEQFHKMLKDKKIPDKLRLSGTLQRKIAKEPGIKWKIITPVRDPVARKVSAFFHNARAYYPEVFDSSGCMDIEKTMSALYKEFSGKGREDPQYSWFEREFKNALGFDACDVAFDPDKGYAIIEKKIFRVMFIRLEDLNRVLFPALLKFMEPSEPFEAPMVTANMAGKKDYYPVYRHVLKKFTLPEKILSGLYSDRYVRHFYSNKEIESFMNKWSSGC